ncbi:MAG: hypothetical protein J4473_02665 [Candidatus Aenigmarchaeota archaeon]|nr:hypothetical protein [Candidatus Aenigmarchaeota archaeon]
MVFSIKSGNYTIQIYSDSYTLKTFFECSSMPLSHIPGYGYTDDLSDYISENSSKLIHDHDGNGIGVIDDTYRIYRFGVRNPEPFDVMYFLIAIFERMRHENGEYSIHSSSVSRSKRAILFMGGRGAGKSTMCYEFINRGWEYGSNERTVLIVSSLNNGTF